MNSHRSSPSMLWPLLRLEWLLQLRSLRFRFAVALSLALAAFPPLLLHLNLAEQRWQFGPTSFLTETQALLPLLSVLLTVAIVGNTARRPGMTQLLISSPISVAGYSLTRLLAQIATVLPLTLLALLPALGLGIWHFGTGDLPLRTALLLWLLEIAPRVLIVASAWLGLVLLVQSEVAAFFLAWLGGLTGEALLDRLTFPLGVRLSESTSWIGIQEFGQWVTVHFFMNDNERAWLTLPATEAPIVLDAATAESLLPLLLPLAGALLALLIGMSRMGRTTPDTGVRPIPPDHPLRTFLQRARDVRDAMRADAGQTTRDRALRWSAAALAIVIVSIAVLRARAVVDAANRRYNAMVAPAITATDSAARIERWSVVGSLGPRGQLSTTTTGVVTNTGNRALLALGFELTDGVRVDAVTATVAGQTRTITKERQFDRLGLLLEPALDPGATLELEVKTSGRPRHLVLPIRGSLAIRWKRHLEARFPRHLVAAGSARFGSGMSPERTELGLSDLSPQPRFTTWELTPPPEFPGGPGRTVPPEEGPREVDLRFDLEVPDTWTLVDSCGQVANAGRLRSSCRQQPATWQLVGGRDYELHSSADGQVKAALLAPHAEGAGTVLSAMSRVAELSREGRGGFAPIERITLWEYTPPFGAHPQTALAGFLRNRDDKPIIKGRLVWLPEASILRPEPIAAEALAAAILIQDVELPEAATEADGRALRALLRTWVLERLGVERESAVVFASGWQSWSLYQPMLGADPYDGHYWGQRVPALLVDLKHRVGGAALDRAFRTTLLEPEAAAALPGPVSVRGLIEAIARESGKDLSQYYADYIARGHLPRLILANVTSRPERGVWRVEGQLRNEGRGQSECPIVVQTVAGPASIRVTVDGSSQTSFELETDGRPHTVVVDPEETCLRFRAWRQRRQERADLVGGDEGT